MRVAGSFRRVSQVNPLVRRLPHPSRLAFLGGAAAVLVAALLARLAGAAQAFVGGELVPLDGDSLYHLRRMRLVADAFPAVPWLDPEIAWPGGGPVPWAAGFDVMGALAILFGRLTGGAGSADLWVASLCALLGVAVVAATMELVHTVSAELPGRRAATLASGILAAAIPQGLAASRFGRIDHHVAEALAMLLLARWAMIVLPPRSEEQPRRLLQYEAAGAALAAWALWIFTGSPLYVALVVPILLAGALLAPRPRLLGSGGPGLLAGAGLAALCSAPAVGAHGRTLAFGFPSLLQPLLLAAAGAAVCGAVLAAGRVAPGWRRALLVVSAAAAMAGLAVAIAPSAAAQAITAVREWLLKADPWLAAIDEFQPILRSPGGPAFGVNRFLGAAGFAAPVALPLAALALSRAGKTRAFSFLGLSTALALLTLLQSRFGRVFVPFLAASAALGLTWLAGRVAGRTQLAWALPVTAALALALVDPRVRATLGIDRDPIPDAATEAAFDLRARHPGRSPGVLAPWDLANAFLVLAGRPVVATGFGPYPDPAAFEDAERAFRVGEEELLPLLERRRVGWLVAGAANLFGRVPGRTAQVPFSGRSLSPQWLVEVPSSPLLLGGSGIPELGVHHCAHLMPVFASTRTVQGIRGVLPVLWTYEVVRGARLRGRARPGVRVVLEVPLLTRGRRLAWRAFADAGMDGRWTLTVPLPTDLAAPTLSTGPARLLVGAGPAVPVAIPATAVRVGAELAAPAR